MTEVQSDQPFVDHGLVKAHLTAGFTWFMVAITAGMLFAFQFHQAYPLAGMIM